MKTFKILVVLNDLDIGGAQNYTISLVNEFIKLGNRVQLIVLSENLLLKDRLSDKINLLVLPRKFIVDYAVLRKIRDIIKNGGYDGIISSYPIYLRLATLFLRQKLVLIYPLHSTIEKTRKSRIINYITFKLKSRREIFLTSIENQTIYLLKAYRLNVGYFTQIYNGIDTEKFIPAPNNFNKALFLKERGINPEHKIILMVAGYRTEKRHTDAFDALNLLHINDINTTLVCVGDNRKKEKDDLQNYINKKGIPNIKLLSSSEVNDVLPFYWSADIFTLTSNKVETFPISVLEALACGLPCVLTDTGGASNIIISSLFGVVVPIENPAAIANAWKFYLKENFSSDKMLIRNHVIANYSIRNSALQYLDLLKK